MKTADKQIFEKLMAYPEQEVKKAIILFHNYLESKKKKEKADVLKELEDNGWEPHDSPIEGKEYHQFFGKYWIQKEEYRLRDIRKAFEQKGKKPPSEIKQDSKKTYTGQKMNLKETDIPCLECGAKTYKQSICPRCKEGKQGYTVRLICEENPDHEFLI